jgi:hypothetical protein
MLRALMAACALWLVAPSDALSCIAPGFFRGVVFETPPPDTPPNALILEVTFEADQLSRDGAMTARVNRVVRGEYDRDTVLVALSDWSCDAPFVFGMQGLIIGYIVTPDEARVRDDQVRVQGGHALLQPYGEGARPIRTWPRGETIFVPMSESVSARRARMRDAN